MWKACGSKKHRPTDWVRQEDTQNFLKALEKELKYAPEAYLKSIMGRYGGTYGHYQIALAYAKYLSPEFHIWCNEVIKEHFEFEADPSLGVDKYTERLIRVYKKMGKTDAWIRDRFDGKLQHKLMMETLRDHGVRRGFGKVLGEVNKAVLGTDANTFKTMKNVKQTRDGMNTQCHCLGSE